MDGLPAGVVIRHGVSAFGWLGPGELRLHAQGASGRTVLGGRVAIRLADRRMRRWEEKVS